MTYWLRALLACSGGFTPRVLTPLCSSIIELQFALTYRLVGREGLEPSMFLMSRIYSPLVSPLSTPTHITGYVFIATFD